jgi:hypothetical protein
MSSSPMFLRRNEVNNDNADSKEGVQTKRDADQ